MAESTTPLRLLDLDTLLARPTIRIDGVEYELRAPDEFSVLEYRRLSKPGARMSELEDLEEPTPEQLVEYDQLLDGLCRQVLLAPDDVHGRLKVAQRSAIIAAFMGLRVRTMARLRASGALTEVPAPGEATTGAN